MDYVRAQVLNWADMNYGLVFVALYPADLKRGTMQHNIGLQQMHHKKKKTFQVKHGVGLLGQLDSRLLRFYQPV